MTLTTKAELKRMAKQDMNRKPTRLELRREAGQRFVESLRRAYWR